MISRNLKTKKDTELLAQEVYNNLCQTDILALFGSMGVGKTFFTQCLCRKLKVKTFVNSPSFVILNEYTGKLNNNLIRIFHFDLYRLNDPEEIIETGLLDLLGEGLVIIEWPDLIKKILPDNTLRMEFSFLDGHRVCKIFNLKKSNL